MSNAMNTHIHQFTELCRNLGIKPTHQRTEIYRDLMSTENHPNAETIYKNVKKRIPAISLDTVYRTLRLFEQKGIISRVSAAGESMRFDGNTQRHHHFICVECGKVRDFYSEEFNNLAAPEEVTALGNIGTVHVEMRGICASCQEKNHDSAKK
ncbi:MAG: Fur family transcriptional regulator [Syntrophotaleaceae bacterium]